MTKSKAATPSGVVAIAMSSAGHIMANVSDFDQSRMGGMSLADAQEYRARQALLRQVARNCCNADFAAAIDSYVLDGIRNNLLRAGWKFETIQVPAAAEVPA